MRQKNQQSLIGARASHDVVGKGAERFRVELLGDVNNF